MIINLHKVNLKKRHPLQISRGVHNKSTNLFVELISDGINAWGECAPGKTEGANSIDIAENSLIDFIESGISSLSIYELKI
jgi:L-alanine-DL-glutamate epimerase-like enolase superfamily enzyme